MFNSTTRLRVPRLSRPCPWHRGILAGLVAVMLLTTSLAAPGVARAASPGDELTAAIEAKASEAAEFFAAKDYVKAVRAYIEAYQIAHRPSELLYNIAFIYDVKLEQHDMATSYYKKYAQATDADPALLEKTIRRMSELRDLKNKQPITPEGPDPKDKKIALVKTPKPSTSAADPGAGQRTAGVGTIVTGGVLVLAAAGLYVGAFLNNDSFSKSTVPGERIDLADQGKTFALAGDVLMGVGGAAALVGIILLVTAPQETTTRGDVNVGATVFRGGAGLVISGSL